ncbi:MAG: hypothetical protein Q8930_20695, partial [Bacillota bacterium]|nr:hypothetical protein [Bacillota bacterium]
MLGFFNFLNVVVAVLSTIFIFRQLFIKFHWSNKALKNVVFSICMVITLFSSYFSSTSGLVAKEHKDNLNFETNYADTHNTPIMLQDEIDRVNKEIDKVYSYSAAEYISFVLGTLIYICILKEYKNVKKEERWDLKK